MLIMFPMRMQVWQYYADRTTPVRATSTIEQFMRPGMAWDGMEWGVLRVMAALMAWLR